MDRVVNVTVSAAVPSISSQFSSITPTETSVPSGEKFVIVVSVKDDKGGTYPNAELTYKMISGPSLMVVQPQAVIVSDEEGRAVVELYAAEVGTAVVEFFARQSDGTVVSVGSGTYTITGDTTVEDDVPIAAKRFVRLSGTSTDFLLKENVLHPFSSLEVMQSWGVTPQIVEHLSSFSSEWKRGSSVKFRDGTLIKGTEAAVSLVTNQGMRAWIKNEEVFLGLGYRWNQIHVISDSELSLYKRTDDIVSTATHGNGTLIKYANDSKVYVLEGDKKRWVASESAFASNGLSFSDIITIHDSEIYPDGSVLSKDERFAS
jgi:hypothetical protein